MALQQAIPPTSADVISFSAAISSCEKAAQWRWALQLFLQLLEERNGGERYTVRNIYNPVAVSQCFHEYIYIYMLHTGVYRTILSFHMSTIESIGRNPD